MGHECVSFQKLEIHFEIISECDLNCIHCSSESGTRKGEKGLSSSKIENVIDSIGANTELYVCLTGGEPLLSYRFFPIVKSLKQFCNIKEIGFFTSGCMGTEARGMRSIDEKMSEQLREAGVTFCYVSLYSHINHVHDQITTVSGSHNLSLESIRNLLRNRIAAKVNMVPMQYNKNGIEKAIYYLDQLGISEIRFLRLVRHGRAEKNWESIGLNRAEQKAIIRKAMEAVEEKGLGVRITIAGFPEFWDCRPFGIGEKCQAGIGLHYIDRKGRVFPCACKKRDQSYFICNIDDNDLRGKLLSAKRVYNLKCLQDDP